MHLWTWLKYCLFLTQRKINCCIVQQSKVIPQIGIVWAKMVKPRKYVEVNFQWLWSRNPNNASGKKLLNRKYALTILFHSYQILLQTIQKFKPLVKSYNYDPHDAPLVSYGGIDAVITSDIRNGNTCHRFVHTTFTTSTTLAIIFSLQSDLHTLSKSYVK